MDTSVAMVVFGWLFIVAMLAAVIIPWLRGKSDLFTVWNLFLLGSANFVGLDSVATGMGRYAWGTFTATHYTKFIIGALAFYIPLFFSYYLIKFPRRLAGNSFLKWPRWDGPALLIMLVACGLLGIWAVSMPQIQGVAQFSYQMGAPAGVIAITLVLANWSRRPFNATLAISFFAVLAMALVLSLFGSTGRRQFMSLLLAIPISVYWFRLRYLRVSLTAWPLLITAILIYLGVASYTAIRHRHVGQEQRFNPVSEAIDSVLMLPSAIEQVMTPLDLLPSGTVSASLVCIDVFPRDYPTYPFQTLFFIVANPFPRALWPSWLPPKPAALGEWLGYTYGVWARAGHFNVSMGIVGHGYYEGGPHMLVFYGLLFGLFMRYADELLLRQCDNPFMIGALAAASGNIVGLSRGEVSVFILLILASYACAWLVALAGRIFSGVGVVYPTDEQRAQIAAEQQMMAEGYGYSVEPQVSQAYAGMHATL